MAPGLTARNKKLLGTRASLLGARTLLGAPGLSTSSKDATRAPGLTARNKKLLGTRASLLGARTLLQPQRSDTIRTAPASCHENPVRLVKAKFHPSISVII